MENVEQMKPEVEQMKQQVEQAKQDTEKVVAEETSKLQEALHRVMLAAVGTLGLFQDEMEHFVNKAVERGQIAEKDARKTMNDVTEKRKDAGKEVDKRFKEVDKRFEDMLVKLNIPTKNDITALNDKIADLTQKVESLKN